MTLSVFRQDVRVVIGPLGVRHHRDLQLGGVVVDDAAQRVLIAVLPLAVLRRREYLLVGLVAELHRVDPGGHAGLDTRP